MKISIIVIFVCALAAVNGAPSNKRFLDLPGLMSHGLDCPFPAMCFIDPCMVATCATNPGAICTQGCTCSAVWTDLAGNHISC